MRTVFGIGFAAAVFALAAGCGKKDGTGGDGGGTGLEGTWLLVGIESEGVKFDDVIAKGKEEDRTMKITGDKMTMTKDGKEDPGTYTVDKSKTPAHIDMTTKKGEKDQKIVGIYKIEGDTLTICGVESDKAEDRPKDFKSEKDSKVMIMTLKKK